MCRRHLRPVWTSVVVTPPWGILKLTTFSCKVLQAAHIREGTYFQAWSPPRGVTARNSPSTNAHDVRSSLLSASYAESSATCPTSRCFRLTGPSLPVETLPVQAMGRVSQAVLLAVLRLAVILCAEGATGVASFALLTRRLTVCRRAAAERAAPRLKPLSTTSMVPVCRRSQWAVCFAASKRCS